ncbi:hypothetical protein BKA65DRAFT_550477 [Rhexocercosporidium sp. MPI-PUGE-AT-0058]|nr:hypothetical protein BKA65DRAFT_550477 [Rhexocercosporidium sp. MPI-PUGE-AT-0058]
MSSNPRDYSTEDYAPRDTIEAIYNTETENFTYKPRSQLIDHMHKDDIKVFPIPRFYRGIVFAANWRADFSQNSPVDSPRILRVRLPYKVLVGRNLLGGFRKLYVLRPGVRI